LLIVTLIATSCSPGPTAPAVDTDAGGTSCIDAFCISYPAGWVVAEEGPTHISLANPASPAALATIAPINQQALVENAGGSWPAPTTEVVAAFWRLLADADVADFDRLERLTGGAFRSEGSYEDGRLWHLIIPGDGNAGIGVEVRGPNASWEAHADAIFGSVEVLGS
jgi:hypothetical protein